MAGDKALYPGKRMTLEEEVSLGALVLLVEAQHLLLPTSPLFLTL
jgi:hypothetical protein